VTLDRVAAVGSARVVYPSSWTPRAASPVAGLPLRHALARWKARLSS